MRPRAVPWPGGTGVAALAAACAAWPAEDAVVLHAEGAEPGSEVVDALLELLDGAAAVATVVPMTDAVKEVDDRGRVVGAPDRAALGHLALPQVLTAGALAAALAAVAPDRADDTPARALLRSGAVVRAVPSPG